MSNIYTNRTHTTHYGNVRVPSFGRQLCKQLSRLAEFVFEKECGMWRSLAKHNMTKTEALHCKCCLLGLRRPADNRGKYLKNNT